jgi:hypothetical protein
MVLKYIFLYCNVLQYIYREGLHPNCCHLVWVCRYCRFWCTMFDPLIIERHLCVDAWTVLPYRQKSRLIFV